MSNLYNDVDVYTAQLRNLENAVRSNPNEADTHFLLAYHYTTAGHPDAAAKQLADVVRLNSNDLEDWLSRQRERSIRVPVAPAEDVALRLIA